MASKNYGHSNKARKEIPNLNTPIMNYSNYPSDYDTVLHTCVYLCVYGCEDINALRPRQNACHFPDDIFKCIFLNEDAWISIKISLKFVPGGPNNNFSALVEIMAWRRPGDKPLSELMMVSLMTHICVTRPQWVNFKMLKHWPANIDSNNLHYMLSMFTTRCDAAMRLCRRISISSNVDVLTLSILRMDVFELIKIIFFPENSRLKIVLITINKPQVLLNC